MAEGYYLSATFFGINLYIYAYINYNISMNVEVDSTPLQKIRQLMGRQNGLLLASDLAKQGIPRTYLSILEEKKEIQRVARGVYIAIDSIADDMVSLQARYRNAIFSHATAMYLHDLTDRSPLAFSVTVPAGYNATSLKENGAKVYFIKGELHSLGLISIDSPYGNEIKSYNLERTICDILRSRNQTDVQIIGEALRRYVAKKEKNLDQLYQYAKKLRIHKIVRAYIEILL